MPFSDAAKAVGVHVVTLHRWRCKGILFDGERRKLRAKKVGGRWFIHPDWIREFEAGVSGEEYKPETLTERNRRIKAASAVLDSEL